MGKQLDVVVARVLHSVLARYRADQIFLFAADGHPFWVARDPITPGELGVFKSALDLLAKLETTHEKPFAGRAPDGSYAVAALADDSDLFIVLIERDGMLCAEERVAVVRDAVLPGLEHLRTKAMRDATTGQA
jgi:hypothetical protein